MPQKKVKKAAPKTIVKQPKVPKPDQKQRKAPSYKSFKLQKRIKHPAGKLPGAFSLLKKAFMLLWVNKKPMGWFLVVYGILSVVFVRGFASTLDIEGVREVIGGIVDEQTVGLATSFSGFSLLVQSATNGGSELAQLYQVILLTIGSLAVIWLFRQQQTGHRVTMKQAFYSGMYPLVPFILVAAVMSLQLLPALLVNFLFQTARVNDLIVNSFELAVWITLLFLVLLLSLYMLASSMFALYVVTLPEMTPMQALREARAIVKYRRFAIIARVVIVFIVLSLLLFVTIVPLIYFVPLVAEWMFFALTILGLPLLHAYMFSLYRELL